MKELLALLDQYAQQPDYDDSDYTLQFKAELHKFVRWANRELKGEDK